MPIPSGVGGRALGIITSPRATFEAVARAPRWLGVLVLTFLVAAGSSAIVLETTVGQLALLDQWERTASAFGRDVTDAEYASLVETSGNGALYALVTAGVSGPLLVLALSAVLFVAFRAAAPEVAFRQVFAIAAHAGVILALRQLIAAPIVYARETLASPITLGTFVPIFDEASPFARFFSIIDLLVVWWVLVLALGMSVLYRRPARRLAGIFVGAYVTLAVVLAAMMAATGGTA